MIKELQLTYKLEKELKSKNLPEDKDKIREADLRIAELNLLLYQHYRSGIDYFDEFIKEASKAGNHEKAATYSKKIVLFNEKCKLYGPAAVNHYSDFVTSYPKSDKIAHAMYCLAWLVVDLSISFPGKTHETLQDAYDLCKQLLKDQADSDLLDLAEMLLGEIQFHEGDYKAALAHYEKAAKPVNGRVYFLSRFRQASCLYLLGDTKGTVKMLEDIIEEAKQHYDYFRDYEVLRGALSNLVILYSDVGKAEQAWTYFEKHGGVSSKDQMDLLGRAYLKNGRWSEASMVFQKLGELFPADHDLCQWQSWKTMASGNQSGTFEITKDECRQSTASLLLGQAVSWHREAAEEKGVFGKGREDTLSLARDLYETVLEKFPDFDDLFKDDEGKKTVTRYQLKYLSAEILWQLGRWSECAAAFEKIYTTEPQGAYAEAAASASNLCRENLHQELLQSPMQPHPQ